MSLCCLSYRGHGSVTNANKLPVGFENWRVIFFEFFACLLFLLFCTYMYIDRCDVQSGRGANQAQHAAGRFPSLQAKCCLLVSEVTKN